ncbi:MAG: hypothetical protein IT484_09155 [Gammaproteobacteria bacterium]|nr:hypothetical protein [Gammaproteobacteria bacterium]
MNARLTGTGVLALAGVVGGVLLLVALRRKAGAVADAINPASADNLAYAGVNRAGASISGNPAWTLGGALFDWTHDAQGRPLWTLDAARLDPASADNLAYAGVNRAGASISGNPAWTLGGWLFDATHDQAGQLVVPGGQWFSDELRRIFGNGK